MNLIFVIFTKFIVNLNAPAIHLGLPFSYQDNYTYLKFRLNFNGLNYFYFKGFLTGLLFSFTVLLCYLLNF